jgi:hypothetical protein
MELKVLFLLVNTYDCKRVKVADLEWANSKRLRFSSSSKGKNTFKINHKIDATISPLFYLTFIYSSTRFGRPHAHHQELNNCSSSLWFCLRSVVITVLLVVVRPAGPNTTNSTAITTLRRQNQRLLLQFLSSWWWAWGRLKHVEL